MRVLPCGDCAVLVELDGLPEVWSFAAAVREAGLDGVVDGVVDVVPAARTVLVVARPGTDLAALRATLQALPVDAGAAEPDQEPVEIPVVYDGPDLDEVGKLTGLGADGVVDAHTGTPWRVGFGGFAPGFAYLTGGDERLQVARHDEPRTSVPAGSVGLAGEFSGIYPRASPGGWQLIGRTDVTLWDARRDPPALLQPGAAVTFVRARPSANGDPEPPARGEEVQRGPRWLDVVATEGRALVQDLGRPGHAAVGVGRSGAADRAALRLANRMLANPEDAAAVEVTWGGLTLRAASSLPAPLLVTVTGAPAALQLDGAPLGHHALVRLRAGQELRIGPPPTGMRSYVGVRGGIAVAAVLGSRSTDTLSGIGPAALREGDVLPVGPEPDETPCVDVAPVAVPPDGPLTLRAVRGPRLDRLAAADALTATEWTVSDRSDRIGMRLTGTPLRRTSETELPSEGLVPGAVQVPPGGEPVVFLADTPVTGGYPVVAVLVAADVDKAAQARPGQRIRLRLVDPPWRG